MKLNYTAKAMLATRRCPHLKQQPFLKRKRKMRTEQGLQGAWVNGKDGRRGLVLPLREEQGDGERKDNEMRAGQAWRRGKTRAQEFFLEGPWRGLAGPCLLSVENSGKQPQTTKLCLFLGSKSGLHWQAGNEDSRFKPASPAPRGTFPAPRMHFSCMTTKARPSLCLSLSLPPRCPSLSGSLRVSAWDSCCPTFVFSY